MSREDVEVVRRVYDAAARRDPPAVFDLYSPEVVLDARALGLVGSARGLYEGHQGLRELFREWHEAWGKIEVVVWFVSRGEALEAAGMGD